MANFIVEFPLKTEKYQEDILNKRFEIGRQIYNSLVNVTQKRYKEMIKTKKYRTLLSSLTGNKKSDKEIWKQINDIRKQYGMSEYSFHKDVKKMQKHFKDKDYFVIGIAKGYDEALGLVQTIVEELYCKRGITDLKEYFGV